MFEYSSDPEVPQLHGGTQGPRGREGAGGDGHVLRDWAEVSHLYFF